MLRNLVCAVLSRGDATRRGTIAACGAPVGGRRNRCKHDSSGGSGSPRSRLLPQQPSAQRTLAALVLGWPLEGDQVGALGRQSCRHHRRDGQPLLLGAAGGVQHRHCIAAHNQHVLGIGREHEAAGCGAAVAREKGGGGGCEQGSAGDTQAAAVAAAATPSGRGRRASFQHRWRAISGCTHSMPACLPTSGGPDRNCSSSGVRPAAVSARGRQRPLALLPPNRHKMLGKCSTTGQPRAAARHMAERLTNDGQGHGAPVTLQPMLDPMVMAGSAAGAARLTCIERPRGGARTDRHQTSRMQLTCSVERTTIHLCITQAAQRPAERGAQRWRCFAQPFQPKGAAWQCSRLPRTQA